MKQTEQVKHNAEASDDSQEMVRRKRRKMPQEDDDEDFDIDMAQLEDVLNDDFEPKQVRKTMTFGEKTPQNKKPKVEMNSAPQVQIKQKKSNVTQSGELVDQEDQNIGGGFQSIDEIKEALPEFLKE